MKAFPLFRMSIGVLALVCGCATPKPTVINLSGTPGAKVAGYYIRRGHRVEFEGTLPMTFSEPGLTQITVRKLNNPADKLNVQARRNGDGEISMGAPYGTWEAVRLELGGGFSGMTIPAAMAMAKPGNALLVIAPYWYNGTWVFDDPAVGLEREPFVEGVPEMINAMVKGIPNAREGFRLTFSAHKFSGYQKKLIWVKAESGGNVYRINDPPMQGWLCPAMFNYFKDTPKEIYVRCDPKGKGP